MGKKPVTKPESSVEPCCAKGCRANASRFTFCEDHFDQFKFGLIRKDGTNVPDYERKFSQYVDFRTRESVRKVA